MKLKVTSKAQEAKLISFQNDLKAPMCIDETSKDENSAITPNPLETNRKDVSTCESEDLPKCVSNPKQWNTKEFIEDEHKQIIDITSPITVPVAHVSQDTEDSKYHNENIQELMYCNKTHDMVPQVGSHLKTNEIFISTNEFDSEVQSDLELQGTKAISRFQQNEKNVRNTKPNCAPHSADTSTQGAHLVTTKKCLTSLNASNLNASLKFPDGTKFKIVKYVPPEDKTNVRKTKSNTSSTEHLDVGEAQEIPKEPKKAKYSLIVKSATKKNKPEGNKWITTDEKTQREKIYKFRYLNTPRELVETSKTCVKTSSDMWVENDNGLEDSLEILQVKYIFLWTQGDYCRNGVCDQGDRFSRGTQPTASVL